MSADLDALDARIAAVRAAVEAPGFRITSERERRNAMRIELANLIPGASLPAPELGPPSEESQASLAELLADLRRIEADAAELRKLSSNK